MQELNIERIEGKISSWKVQGFQKLSKGDDESHEDFERRCKQSDAFVELKIKTEIKGSAGVVSRLAATSPAFHGLTEALDLNNAFSRKIILEEYPDSEEYELKLTKPALEGEAEGELLFHWLGAKFKKIRVSLTKSNEQTVEFTFDIRLVQSLDELRKIDGVNVFYTFGSDPAQQSLL